MAKISFNIIEHKPTGVHTIQVLIQDCNPGPIIDILTKVFFEEMQVATIAWKAPSVAIEFRTEDAAKARMLRQGITEYYFEQGITVN